MTQKVEEKSIQYVIQFLNDFWIDFWSIFYWCWLDFWSQVGPKIDQKQIKIHHAFLTHLGANLEPYWSNLWATWSQLGSTWSQLGPNLGPTWLQNLRCAESQSALRGVLVGFLGGPWGLLRAPKVFSHFWSHVWSIVCWFFIDFKTILIEVVCLGGAKIDQQINFFQH